MTTKVKVLNIASKHILKVRAMKEERNNKVVKFALCPPTPKRSSSANPENVGFRFRKESESKISLNSNGISAASESSHCPKLPMSKLPKY